VRTIVQRGAYINDLRNVVDMEVVRAASRKLVVDPLGSAAVRSAPLSEPACRQAAKSSLADCPG
jgi:phosphoglucomutase